jgi:hypothetical protein
MSPTSYRTAPPRDDEVEYRGGRLLRQVCGPCRAGSGAWRSAGSQTADLEPPQPVTRSILLATSVALLAACSAAPTMGAAPGRLMPLTRAARNGAFGHRGSSADTWLWATGQLNDAVYAFDVNQSGYPIVATITQGVSEPIELTVDAAGTLYVANDGNGSVTEYPVGQTALSVTLTGVDAPYGVAVDASGTVYVANQGTPGSIAVFPPGRTSPTRYVVHRMIQAPAQMFFDATGTLYVIDCKTGVYTLANGTGRPQSLHLRHLGGQPFGIAQDPSDGGLIEGDAFPADGSNRARVYRAGHRRVEYGLDETITVHAVAVGRLGGKTAYVVAAYGPGDPIYLYRKNRRRPYDQINNSILGINGIAFQSQSPADARH